MTTSPDCRLLCASMTASVVTSNGPITEQPAPYYAGAQFVDDPPLGFVGGFNACLVGTTIDGVILAFRATLPLQLDHEQTIRDWINDLDAELIRGDGLPGLVHAGFWAALDSLWSPVLLEVQRRLTESGPSTKLYVTGHSKGGAVADLAGMRFVVERGVSATIYTFAAPHPGDETFANAFADHLQATRYEYADDIVPLLPPSLAFREMFASVPFMQPYLHRFDLDYAPVGELRYITKEGNIVSDSPTLRFRRYLNLAELIVAGGFEEIVTDHRGACGGGYMNAVCPQGVCP